MKYSLLILGLLAASPNAFSTTYCWDFATASMESLIRDLNACGISQYDAVIQNVVSELRSPDSKKNPYAVKVTKALKPLYPIFNTDLPFGSSGKDPCVKEVVKTFPARRLEVLDAAVLCR